MVQYIILVLILLEYCIYICPKLIKLLTDYLVERRKKYFKKLIGEAINELLKEQKTETE